MKLANVVFASLFLSSPQCADVDHGIHANGKRLCERAIGPITTEGVMDLIEAYFADTEDMAVSPDPTQQVNRYIEVGLMLTEILSFECCFEDVFLDCAPLYMAGYTLVASGDHGANRQENAIKALRFADLVGHQNNHWCEPEVLHAFRRRWPSADRSAVLAFDWIGCGASHTPLSWQDALLGVCSHFWHMRREMLPRDPGTELFHSDRPYPAAANMFCPPKYFIIPPLTANTSLKDFHTCIASRSAMVSTPLWSREVQSSCPKHFGCKQQGHFMLVEALRHVSSEPGAFFLEFGSADGESTNVTAKYLQELARLVCSEHNTSSHQLGVTSHVYAECMRVQTPLLYAFDSFHGLPGDWFEHEKGTFGREGLTPPVEHNVRFYLGWYNESLPHLAKDLQFAHQRYQRRSGAINLRAAFVNIDCDLYESTFDALFGLQSENLLQPGTVVYFDELIHHRSAFSGSGELAALYDLLIQYPRHIEVMVGAWRRSTQEIGGSVVVKLL